MEDLKALNERILAHIGVSGIGAEHCLQYTTICLAKLKPSAKELTEFTPNAKENSLDITSLNRTYLEYARIVARDVMAGYFDGLLILGVNLVQAQFLSGLSNQQIMNMAIRWDGIIFVPAIEFKHVGDLHHKSRPHYATALLAA